MIAALEITIPTWLVVTTIASFVWVIIGLIVGKIYQFGDLIILAITMWPLVLFVDWYEKITGRSIDG